MVKKNDGVVVSIGICSNGSIDVDILDSDSGNEWNFNNLNLSDAEFLHDELGRAIQRQKDRGFPKPEPVPTDPVSVSEGFSKNIESFAREE